MTRQRLAAGFLLAGTSVAWIIPSDVPGLIATQVPVLLGRYSEGRFVGLALLTLLIVPSAGMLAWGTRAREVVARMMLLTVSVLLGFAVLSVLMWLPVTPRYVETPIQELVPDASVRLAGITRRRQPHQTFELQSVDRPDEARSYPDPPPGFPTATITLHTDRQGFRNAAVPERCPIVVVGDSFAEGSMVSDDEVWSALLARSLGSCVYNAAVSGAAPREYLNNLVAFGLPLHPERVVVMVYEGNDFKHHRAVRTGRGEPLRAAGAWQRFRAWLGDLPHRAFRTSPLRARLRRWLLDTLGPIRSDRPVAASPVLEWMPVRLESRGVVNHYSFEPGRLLRLYWERDQFRAAPHWTTNASVFQQLGELGRRDGFQLLMVYAPSKPHVVMPLVRERVRPEALRAFATLAKDALPPAPEFAEHLYASLDTQESVFFEFCREQEIDCVSLTQPLRTHMAAGDPVYFTYDPHWTRVGHVRVAEVLARHLRQTRPEAGQAGRDQG